jgi:hypothetical protein
METQQGLLASDLGGEQKTHELADTRPLLAALPPPPAPPHLFSCQPCDHTVCTRSAGTHSSQNQVPVRTPPVASVLYCESVLRSVLSRLLETQVGPAPRAVHSLGDPKTCVCGSAVPVIRVCEVWGSCPSMHQLATSHSSPTLARTSAPALPA